MSASVNQKTRQARRQKATPIAAPAIRPKAINLALQGGGAHGAFTWGVLDGLLEDGRVAIEAISGTSAGAMNAVVLADGMMKGGRDGARQALSDFWNAVSRWGSWSPLTRSLKAMMTGDWNLDDSVGFLSFDVLSRFVSPYQANPLNVNPLRDLLEAQIDFERVRSCNLIKVFVSATNVRNGRVKVFECEDLSPDAVMASACVPHLFQAVEIDGESYWDGGYMGNPVLFPFAYNSDSKDIVIVQINPLEREKTPTTAREIVNRVNEITFNASLMKELRAIDFVARLLDEGALDPNRYKRMLIHRIDAETDLKPLNASSKLNAEWAFLSHLHDIGRRAAAEWLDENHDRIGEESSVDIRSMFT